jgi:hypothetical protein
MCDYSRILLDSRQFPDTSQNYLFIFNVANWNLWVLDDWLA